MKKITKIFVRPLEKLIQVRERYGQTAVIAIIIGVLLAANLLSKPVNIRFDLSKNKAYTLSAASKNILKNLPREIKIKAYTSGNLPAKMSAMERDALDLIGEFIRANPSKLSLQKLDPEKDQKIVTEAEKAGIPKLQFNQLGQNNFQSTKGYFGLALESGEKKEILPTLTNLDTLEYDLISLIYKMSKNKLEKVGVMGGGAGMNPLDPAGDPYLPIREILSQQFEVSQVPLATSSASIGLEDKKALLIIADEGTRFDENTSKQLEAYLRSGGNAVILADGVMVNGASVTKNTTGLEGLFSTIGLKMAANMIAATTAEIIQYRAGQQIALAQYPLWFRTDGFEKKNPIFSGVDSLFFPWVSSLEIDASSSAKPKILANSPTSSWALTEPYDIAPENQKSPNEDKYQTYPLVAEATLEKGKVIVATTSRLANSQFLQKAQGNLAFLLNTINSFASDGALSGIRARIPTSSPLLSVSPQMQEMFKYTLVLLGPLAITFLSLIRLVKRSKKLRG